MAQVPNHTQETMTTTVKEDNHHKVVERDHKIKSDHSNTDKVIKNDKKLQEKQREEDQDNEPSKMHAVKERMVGGIKETVGTVTKNEALKEAGREQKREGDAEALAAGKGQKHYDPALARRGVGFQHKHIGPNPKKITEGPCAGCTEGTCQVGEAYDAAICHSVTQGHCDAGHVKAAGMGADAQRLHDPSCPHNTVVHTHATPLGTTATTTVHPVGTTSVVGGHPIAAVPVSNVAYDRAATTKTTTACTGHGSKDVALMDRMAEDRYQCEKQERKAERDSEHKALKAEEKRKVEKEKDLKKKD